MTSGTSKTPYVDQDLLDAFRVAFPNECPHLSKDPEAMQEQRFEPIAMMVSRISGREDVYRWLEQLMRNRLG